MKKLPDHIFNGPVVGIGFSGQAGSAFPVLGVLHILQEAAKREGRTLKALYAFDPGSNPKLAPVIERVAQNYGIETTYIREVPISQYREGVDSGHLFLYGLKPDLDLYVESELHLFRETQPSLILSILRPTLHFSRDSYRQRTGHHIPYLAFGYSILLGSTGDYGIPANFIPFLPKPIERMLDGNPFVSFIANRIIAYKHIEGRRYLQRFLSRTYWSEPFPHILHALFGDVTLIPSSPIFIPDAPPEHSYILGLINITPALSPQQKIQQEGIFRQIDTWKAAGEQVIFIGMGTSGKALPLVVQAFAELIPKFPRIKLVIATTILKHPPKTQSILRQLQSKRLAVIHNWFDLPQLLPRVDLIVSHGGLNTLEFALQSSVPPLVIAPQQAEQGLNALILRRQELGEVVWGHRLEEIPHTLAKMLRELPAYRARVAQHRQRYADYYDPERQREKIIQAINEAFHLAPVD